MAQKVSIVIPTKNRLPELRRLLNSLYNSDYKTIEIIVVNDSQISIRQKLKEYNLTLIENNKINGLAFSRNRGAKRARGKYILFIDDDNIIEKEAISFLVDSFRRCQNLIAVGPITYYLSNPQKIWFIGSKINLTTSKSFFYQKPPREKIISHNLFAVENLHNCFMVKKEIGEKVSWFDEKMIISGTEIDMFLRIKKINPDYFLAINLDARCYHDILTPKENLIRNLGFNRPKRAYFFQRNRAILISKHGNLLQKLLFGLLFYPFFLLAYGLLFIIKKRFDLLYNHLKATGVGYYYLFKGF